MLLSGGVKITLPKSNSSPLKMGLPKRNVVSQPSIFMGYVNFTGVRTVFWLQDGLKANLTSLGRDFSTTTPPKANFILFQSQSPLCRVAHPLAERLKFVFLLKHPGTPNNHL